MTQNERLRSALEKIAKQSNPYNTWEYEAKEMKQIAREALAEPPEDGWISVETRLPEHNRLIIEEREIGDGHIYEITWADEEWRRWHEMNSVTRWTCFTAPPKINKL